MIAEAHCLALFLAGCALLLLAMATGLAPADDWHVAIMVAAAGLSLGCITGWIIRDVKRKG